MVGSAYPREASGTLITHAGPEIGVASTKAFTSQLTALLILGMHLGQVRGTLDAAKSLNLTMSSCKIPGVIEDVLRRASIYEELTQDSVPRAGFSISGAGHSLSDCARRRAQAEGDFLYSRRRLSGGRDEARAERAD